MGIQEHINFSSDPKPILTHKNWDIAIVGASCRLPGANSMHEFWELLINGVDTIGPVPPERTYMTGTKEMNGGFLKCPLDEFDAGFFNYSALAAQFLDPQLRLFLEVTWEALENAGIIPSSLSQKTTGIYMGVGVAHYKNLYEKYFTDKTRLYGFLGNEWSGFAGKLAQLLNIHGPCLTMESACSASGQAIYEAVKDLRNGKIEIGLASGMNEILMRQLNLPDLLYSSGCKVFDESADGFAPAEAIATVVLKRLADAVEDGDPILGVIRGVALNHNGTSKSLGTPNPFATTQLMTAALLDSGLESGDVTFLEAHGTGTRVGDPLEARSIVQVFGENQSPRNQPLLIGSVKTNVGHTLMASGIVSLLKILLCLKHEIIPKHLHLKHLNPSINFNTIPAILPLSPTAWLPNSQDQPLRGMFNNFGITGVNVSMVVEEWRGNQIMANEEIIQNSPPYSILIFSAKQPQALSTLANLYREKLVSDPEIQLSDLARTLLGTRESQFTYRAALVAKTKDECIRKLGSQTYETNTLVNENQESSDPILFLFSGQGSTYFGMGKELYSTCPIFKKAFEHGNSLFKKLTGISLKEALWEEKENFNNLGPKVTQGGLYIIQHSLFKVWTELFGIWPSYVLGHSIGEYGAAVGAGIMTFEDGLLLIIQRATLIAQLNQREIGGMMAMETSVQTAEIHIQKFLSTLSTTSDSWIDISAQNSPTQTVVSGPKGTLENFKNYLHHQNCDFKTKILNTTHAFHSRAMDPIITEYKKVLNQITFSKPKNCKFISTVLGHEITEALGSEYWIRNLRDPVLFAQGIENVRQDVKFFIELGPQPILLSLLPSSAKTTETHQFLCPSIRSSDPSCWKTLLSSLAKIYTNWNGKINFGKVELLEQFPGKKIHLPNYPFQRKKYWMEIPESEIETRVQFPGQSQNIAMFHPFLGTKLSIMGSIYPVFNNFLTRSSIPWFQEHVIADLVIVPAACFVESCLRIGKELLGERETLVLENIVAKKALLLTEDSRQFQTLITPNPFGNEIEVMGGSKENPELSWTCNFTGSIRTNDLSNPSSHGLLNLSFIDQAESIDSNELYEAVSRAGLSYGPKFRIITKFWVLEDQIIGHIKNIQDSDSGQYTIHPCILDGMLHMVSFELYERDKRTNPGSAYILRLPLHFRKVEWHVNENKFTENLYVSRALNTSGYEVTLHNQNGHLICLLQFSIVETSREGFIKANSPVNEKLPGFYEESWIQQPKNQKEQNNDQFNWLIVSRADQKPLAKELQTLIISSNQKSKVFICYHGDGNEKPSYDNNKSEIVIDFTNLTSFEKLIGLGQINGIINLWGLGNCPNAQSRDLATVATLNSIKFGLTITNPPIQRMCLTVENVLDLGDRELELGSSNPNSSVLLGLMKTFISEYPGIETSVLNFDSRKENSGSFAPEIHEKLGVLGQETQYVLRENKTLVPRLRVYPIDNLPPPDLLLLSTQKKFRIQPISTPNSTAKDFRFSEIEEWDGAGASIRIKASALNFRDLIVYRSSLLEARGFEFGCEYSGIIEEIEENWGSLTGFRVGDRVCGVGNGNTFGSHIYTSHGNNLMKLPNWMSFNQGATLPVVFLTTYESLVGLAKLSPGEKVLIHNGSGGVGLSAIQIARHLGAQVFVTAGTNKKRNYLKRVIGLSYVYDSRSTSFASEILRDTNGTGVDVVLNTLTSPGFKEASLSVLLKENSDLAKTKRFIELSKLNIWTTTELLILRPDVKYFIYDLNSKELNESSTSELGKLFNSRALSPLPYESFTIQELDVALRKFQAGNHIGKFIIEISYSRTLFHPENSYLITGGLGGIGLDVAKWIIEQGGKDIVLTGRNPPTSPHVLKKLEGFGSKVRVILADISEENSVNNLLKEVGPNLKGIFHAAGILPDSVLLNQTLESFRSAYKPKVDGTWNLHNQTLNYNLDYFVVFSSIASIVGFAGQGSYTAANQFLDSFTHYRLNELGLPGLSINYGGWADVGIAGRFTPEHIKALTKRSGIAFFSPAEGIRGLEKAIRLKLKQITIANIDTEGLGKTAYPKLRAYVSKLDTFGVRSNKSNLNPSSSSSQNNNNSNNAISKLAQSIRAEKDFSKLGESVGSLVEECFKLYTGMDEEFDSNTSTMLLGMDSLMSMEIMNRLNKEIGIPLSRKKFQESKTPAEITNYLVEVLSQ